MDFYEKLTALINAGIMEKGAAKTTDPVAEEIFQHSSFCQSKAKSFHGREEFLSDVKETIKKIASRVVVLYGPSGCGKTSLMAKIAAEIGNWFEEEGSSIVVIRFIGTTPDSSSTRFLLRSICLQLCKATQQPESSVPEVRMFWFPLGQNNKKIRENPKILYSMRSDSNKSVSFLEIKLEPARESNPHFLITGQMLYPLSQTLVG